MRALVALLLIGCADTAAPAWPTGASLSTEAGEDRVTFTWPPPADDRGVSVFVVRIDGSDTARLGPDQRRYSASDLAEASEHDVEVVAIDQAGNESVALSTRVTIPDRTAPAFEAGAVLTVRAEGRLRDAERALELSWPEATDAVGVARYRVERDGHEVPATTPRRLGTTAPRWSAQLERAPLTDATRFAVVAIDAAGNESPRLEIRWDGTSERDRERRVEQAMAEVEAMLLGTLSNDSGTLSDVLRSDGLGSNEAPQSAEDVLARAEGVRVPESGSTARQGGGAVVGDLAHRSRVELTLTQASGSRPRSEVDSALRARMGAVRDCYDRQRRAEPALAGDVRLQIMAREDGSVGPMLNGGTLGTTLVGTCIESALRQAHLAPGESGLFDAHVTLRP